MSEIEVIFFSDAFRIGDIVLVNGRNKFAYVSKIEKQTACVTTTLMTLSKWKLFRWFQIKWYNIKYKTLKIKNK